MLRERHGPTLLGANTTYGQCCANGAGQRYLGPTLLEASTRQGQCCTNGRGAQPWRSDGGGVAAGVDWGVKRHVCYMAACAIRPPVQYGRLCNTAACATWPPVQYGHQGRTIVSVKKKADASSTLLPPRDTTRIISAVHTAVLDVAAVCIDVCPNMWQALLTRVDTLFLFLFRYLGGCRR